MKKNLIFIILIATQFVIVSCGCIRKSYNNKRYADVIKDFELKNLIFPDSIMSFYPERNINYYDSCLTGVLFTSNAFIVDNKDFSYDLPYSYYYCVYEHCSISSKMKLIDSMLSLYPTYTQTSINECTVLSNEHEIIEEKNNDKGIPYSEANKKCFVPYFSFSKMLDKVNISDSTTASGLINDFQVITFHGGDSFILPQTYYYQSDKTPISEKHGYRSGIAFRSEDEFLLFYTIAW